MKRRNVEAEFAFDFVSGDGDAGVAGVGGVGVGRKGDGPAEQKTNNAEERCEFYRARGGPRGRRNPFRVVDDQCL